MALRRFREDSLSFGETEWIPYVTQAQELVRAHVEYFSRHSEVDAKASAAFVDALLGGESSRSGGDRLPLPKSPTSADARGNAEDESGGDQGEHGVGFAKGAQATSGKNDTSEKSGQETAKDAAGATTATPSGPFRFFQSSDGQKAFLHPLDMRQLLDDAELGMPLPNKLDAEVR